MPPSYRDDVYVDVNTGTITISSGVSAETNKFYFGGSNDTYGLILGNGGTASFTTHGIAEVGYQNSADATVQLRYFSTWDADSILIGALNATGKVRVYEGYLDVDDYISLGGNLSASGYLEAERESTVDVGGNLNVGLYGYGNVELDEAEVTVGGLMRLGYGGSGSEGFVNVKNNSTLNVTSDDLIIGNEGKGTFYLGINSSVFANADVYVANRAGSDGELRLNEGSSYFEAGNLYVGGKYSADPTVWSFGEIEVSGNTRLGYGATMTLLNEASFITDTAELWPYGGDATLSVFQSDDLTVFRIGTLTVGDPSNPGGTAYINLGNHDGVFAIGDEADSYTTPANQVSIVGSSGASNVTIIDETTLVIEGGAMGIGSVSGLAGEVLVNHGATLRLAESVDYLTIGENGGAGTLNQIGSGSLDFDGPVYVGDGSSSTGLWANARGTAGSVHAGSIGYGELQLFSGLLAVTDEFEIGSGNGIGSGKLIVDDAELTVGGYFTLYANAASEVTVQNEGSLQITDSLTVANRNSAGSTFTVQSTDGTFSSVSIGQDCLVQQHSTFSIDANSQVLIGTGDTSDLSGGAYVLVSNADVSDVSTLSVDNGQATISPALHVGRLFNELGKLEILNASGSLTTESAVNLGLAGDAIVEIDGGAHWQANGGSFAMGDSSNYSNSGSASIALTNGSSLAVQSDMVQYGNYVSVSLDSASQLSISDDAYFGCLLTATTADVTLDASALTLGGDLHLGDLGFGFATLSNESTLDMDGTVYVGGNGGHGELTFNASGDVDGLPGVILAGGSSGTNGFLNLYNGSDVAVRQVMVGEYGNGYAYVSGSLLTIEDSDTSELRIGNYENSTGTVEIYNGGELRYENLTDYRATIGRSGVGKMRVSGTGSKASFSCAVRMGNGSTSTGSELTVENGAEFYGTTLQVRNGALGTATGEGTLVSLSGKLNLNHASGSNQFTVDAGAILKVDNLHLSSINTFEMLNGATLYAMSVIGDLTNTSGIFSPGASPAAVTVEGDYQQLSSGELLLELGGTTAGTEYDVLTITGSATLAGALTVELIDDFTPSGGDVFTVLNYASLVDNGVSLSLPDLDAGLEWAIDWGATSLTLTVGYSADLTGFRLEYGLAEDGSDDSADWSGNGLENILYFAFDLGDPSVAIVNEAYLPTYDMDELGDVYFRYVRLIDSSEVTYTVYGSYDLSTWVDIFAEGADPAPTYGEVAAIDDDYEYVYMVFEGEGDPVFLYVDVETREEAANE